MNRIIEKSRLPQILLGGTLAFVACSATLQGAVLAMAS